MMPGFLAGVKQGGDHLNLGQQPLQRRDIVVIGASAGGVEMLKTLVSGIPADYPGAILIVLHTSPEGPSALPEILSHAGHLSAFHPYDGQPLLGGRIYVAPPNQHLIIEGDRVRLIRGPRENRNRPAIDPLFRSAALHGGPRAIGVILSGLLDDGTAGLYSIKRAGGLAIVQNPAEAPYSGMPASAIENVDVDYVRSVADIPGILVREAAFSKVLVNPNPADANPLAELRSTTMNKTNMENSDEHPGEPSVFSCPECHGTLWETRSGEITSFRCRVGHAFSGQSLELEKSHEVERALSSALRVVEEAVTLYDSLSRKSTERGDKQSASIQREQAARLSHSADVIRRMLMRPEEGYHDLRTQEQHGT